MYEFRGFYVITCGDKYEEWTCLSCGSKGTTISINHTEDCNYKQEILGLQYFHNKIDKIMDENWELNNKYET